MMSDHLMMSPEALPAALNDIIHLDPTYNVLICKGNGCRKAVTPSALSDHLRKTHNTTIELRRQVESYVEQFKAHFDYDYKTVVVPPDGSAVWPVIRGPVDGFQCKHCPLKSVNRHVTRQHCNQEHNLKRKKDEELLKSVRLQTWFQDHRERYWVVDENKEGEADANPASVLIGEDVKINSDEEESTRNALEKSDSQLLLEQLKREYRQYDADEEQRRLQLPEKVPPTENDSWLHFTGWNGVLSASKHDIRKTYHFVRKPEKTEVELERVLQAWDRIVNRCLDTLGDVDNIDVLKWLQSPRQEEPASRPFRLPQSGYTLVKYGGLWHHFLCYVFRTAPDDEWEESTETGVWFTSHQRKSIRRMRELLRFDSDDRFDEFTEPEERDAELTEELMGFCLKVVTQDLQREKVYRSPLMHFLAVMGIDTAAGTLRGAFAYTPTLAAALWINRLLMLEMAVSLKGWRGLKIPAKEETSSIKDRVDRVRRKYLCLSSYTPTSSILSQLAMGRKLNKAYGRPPNIYWADEDTIVYRGMPIPLAKLQLLAQGIITEAEEALNELTFGAPLPDIDLSLIADPLISTSDSRKSGYSLFHNERIQKLKTLDLMLERSVNAPKDQRLYERGPNGVMNYNDRNVKNYLTKEKRLLRKVMVAMQIDSGQPARKPEIGSVKIRTSVYSLRNLHVINGRMAFITEYDKSRSIRGVSHYVVRFLPDRLGQVLMKYIVYIDPFARPLPMDRQNDEFLFSGPSGPWTGVEGTETLIEATEKYLGVRLTWGAWRQVAIGFKDWLLYKEMKVFKEEERGNDDEDDEEEFESLELNTLSHVMDRQSAHSSRTARAHYAVDSNFLSGLRPALIHAYETASLAWHNMLGVGSSKDAGLKASKHRRNVSDVLGVDENKKTRSGKTPSSQKTIKEEDDIAEQIQTGLTRLFGLQGAPRSTGQAEALQVILRRPKTSVVVLPTDGGKSLLYMLPAILSSSGTVIVVVPYVELLDHLLVRATKQGLDCIRWHYNQMDQASHQLVLVSADLAVSELFIEYASQLKNLKHVFFDEAHCAYTETSFRERLTKLWRLRYLDAPTTFLTATLPKALEGTLFNRMLLSKPHTVVYRQPTWRKTIQYEVVDSKGASTTGIVAGMVQKLSAGFVTGQRGVVYVRSYEAGRRLQEKLHKAGLDVPFYKAVADDKSEIFKAWAEGSGGWIIATGALGTGLDVAGITHVIHLDRPYGMTNFVQQAGRGGRGGIIGHSVVVVNLKAIGLEERFEVLSRDSVDAIEEEALTRFLKTMGCRREAIAAYMDDLGDVEAASCESIDGVWCDYCMEAFQCDPPQLSEFPGLAVAKEEPDGSEMIAERFRVMGEELDAVMSVLNKLGRRCVYCEVVFGGTVVDDGHTYAECQKALEDRRGADFASWKRWRKRLRLPEDEYSHCWRCGLPQSICLAMVEDDAECAYPDIVLPVIFLLLKHSRLDSKLRHEFGFQGKSDSDFMTWLGREEVCFDGKETPINKIFRWFALEYECQEGKAVRGIAGIGRSKVVLVKDAIRDAEAGIAPTICENGKESLLSTPPNSQPKLVATVIGKTEDERDKIHRVVEWLSKYCIYCELVAAPTKGSRHWYETCPRQPLCKDECRHSEYVDWHDGVDEHRTGRCWSCKEEVDDCDVRSSLKVTCQYAHVMLPALFILQRRGWLRKWMDSMEYPSDLAEGDLQRWLNEPSAVGQIFQSRAVEAFEAYALQFTRLE